MSFLNQLKTQAQTLQQQNKSQVASSESARALTEAACRTVQHYLQELARQLNVIEPAAPKFTLDGKTPWPAMKFNDFRVDARKKMLEGTECFDYIGMGWKVVPQIGKPVGGKVSVNFPPDLQRVEARLAMGPVKHERKELRNPDNNKLLAIEFIYLTETRGNVVVTPDHAKALLSFRLLNATGFEVLHTKWPAVQVTSDLLDELAKLLVGQPQRFAG
jgi:hypothetical protein